MKIIFISIIITIIMNQMIEFFLVKAKKKMKKSRAYFFHKKNTHERIIGSSFQK